MNSTTTIEISSSPMSVVIAILSGIIMTSLAAVVAFRESPDGATSEYVRYVGYAGLFLAPLITIIHVWRTLQARGPVLTLTSTGIRDRRLAPEEIPWSGIYGLATWEFQAQKSLVLSVDPEVETALHLTRAARWARSANQRYGADGLCVVTSGLEIDHESLQSLCEDRIRRAHPEAPEAII